MLAEFPALCASSLGRDPVGKDRRQDAGAGSDRTDHDQHQHNIRCPRYEEQSNCQHGECGCDEPAGRVRLEPGRECNCLHHKHDQAALGEHQCNLIWTQTEFLFTTQCEPDLEDPDPNRNDESEDEEFWHEPCFFDRPRPSISSLTDQGLRYLAEQTQLHWSQEWQATLSLRAESRLIRPASSLL